MTPSARPLLLLSLAFLLAPGTISADPPSPRRAATFEAYAERHAGPAGSLRRERSARNRAPSPASPVSPGWNLAVADVTEMGECHSVEVAGDFAYASIGHTLVVFDLSSSSPPTRTGYLLLGESCWDIAHHGGYLYAVGSGTTLYIIDVSDPASPQLAGTLPSESNAVDVDGNRLYLCHQSDLTVYDLAVPTAPALLGSTPVAYAIDVRASGDFAYVAGLFDGLHVINVSSPSSPSAVGYVGTGGGAYKLALLGTHALVLNWNGAGLFAIDVSVPSSPTVTTNIGSGGGEWWDVETEGVYAYVLDAYGMVETFDMSNPASPVRMPAVTSCDQYYANDMALAGSQLVVGTGAPNQGLCFMSLANPAQPQPVGSLAALPQVFDVTLADDHLAACYGNGHLMMVNRYDTSLRHGAYGSGWFIDGALVAVSGGKAYVATCDSWGYVEDDGLEVYDISDPAAPQHVGFLPTTWCNWGLATGATHVYTAPYGKIRIVDTGDPSQPQLVGELSLLARGLVESGTYLYVASPSEGLVVVDVSNPAIPAVVGELVVSGEALDVWVANDVAYVASHGSGGDLWIADVSDPANPALTGSIGVAGPRSLVVRGNYLYLAVQDAVRVFDITNPIAPVEAGNISLGSEVFRIVAAPPSLFALTDGALVEIATPLVTATSPTAPALTIQQNRPNPFNPTTTIDFSLATTGHVSVAIFDVRGRRLRTLVNELLPAGAHATAWDGEDDRGGRVRSGVYFCRLTTSAGVRTMKMTLLK